MDNFQILKYTKRIPNFKGVFMRNELRNPRKNESLIINLDSNRGLGTHWVAVKKRGDKILYFDPFGIQPPKEVILYYKPLPVYYSKTKVQKLNATNCGKLRIKFLKSLKFFLYIKMDKYFKSEWSDLILIGHHKLFAFVVNDKGSFPSVSALVETNGIKHVCKIKRFS